MCGFGNDYHISLDIPAQDNLGRCPAVFLCQPDQRFILKQISAGPPQGTPYFHGNIAAETIINQFIIIKVGMGFHLIDGRLDVCPLLQFIQMAFVEITDPDGPYSALFIELLHGSPGLGETLCRPMNQVKVDVIGLKGGQAFIKCFLCPSGPYIIIPQLCGKENLLAGNFAFTNCVSHAFFISIYLCSVDVPVSGLQRPANSVHGLLSVSGLIYAQA